MKRLLLVTALFSTVFFSCNREGSYQNAYQSINGPELAVYVERLGSDEFMGRAPFTEGEEITTNYLAEKLKEIGFDPAFGDSYFQEVDMVMIQTSVDETVIVNTPSKSFNLNTPSNIAIISPRIVDNARISESEMIFAGFGITAPEYSWDDYAGLDVEGKTVVVFVNDPGLYTDDPDFFKGNEMTYYGRWTYKYEEAARRGAEGVLIIHETLGAGYPYGIPRNSCMTPTLYMNTGSGNSEMCLFTGWIESETANDLFKEIGRDVSELRAEACKNDFKGFAMNSDISFSFSNTINENSSKNVAGVLKGSSHDDEVIIYSGHWDHFGIGEVQNGDSIYNGAVDNGTTMAMLFEIGQAFKSLSKPPQRSIMLFFPTAEEQGLLGSKYYINQPAFPIEKTVANLNNDLVLPIGLMKDVMVTGYGQSDLDDYLKTAAEKQDRYLFPDPNSHTGMYFRSDHFPFASVGVPALYARGNCDSREHGKEWAAEQESDYISTKYHKAADNYFPETWNFEGIVEDAQLMFEIGYKLANSKVWPGWKEGSEFKHLR